MENFLNENQVVELQEKGWGVNPKGFYIILYSDDFMQDVWEILCENSKCPVDSISITLLSFGTKIN